MVQLAAGLLGLHCESTFRMALPMQLQSILIVSLNAVLQVLLQPLRHQMQPVMPLVLLTAAL